MNTVNQLPANLNELEKSVLYTALLYVFGKGMQDEFFTEEDMLDIPTDDNDNLRFYNMLIAPMTPAIVDQHATHWLLEKSAAAAGGGERSKRRRSSKKRSKKKRSKKKSSKKKCSKKRRSRKY
jgi:hypothetical protein